MLLQCLVPVIKNSELLSIKAEWFPAGSKLHLHLKKWWGFLLNLSQCLGFLLHANEDKLFCSCHIIYKKSKITREICINICFHCRDLYQLQTWPQKLTLCKSNCNNTMPFLTVLNLLLAALYFPYCLGKFFSDKVWGRYYFLLVLWASYYLCLIHTVLAGKLGPYIHWQHWWNHSATRPSHFPDLHCSSQFF